MSLKKISKEEYRLEGNDILMDECLLNDWYESLRRRARVTFNPISNFPPEYMFKHEEDKVRIKLVIQKTREIISIYEELFERFEKSLSKEDKENLY